MSPFTLEQRTGCGVDTFLTASVLAFSKAAVVFLSVVGGALPLRR